MLEQKVCFMSTVCGADPFSDGTKLNDFLAKTNTVPARLALLVYQIWS